MTEDTSNGQTGHKPYLDSFAAEVLPKITEALQHIERFGSFGWTVPVHLHVGHSLGMLLLDSKEKADEYVSQYYLSVDPTLQELENELTLPEFDECQPMLRQCFAAFRREDYAITLPALTSIFERMIRKLLPSTTFYETRFKDDLERVGSKMESAQPGFLIVHIFRSVHAFQKWFYERFDAVAASDRPYRHGLQHGTQVPSNDRTNALRLFNALCTLSCLHRNKAC